MHVYFPERRALCIAENATHVLHNILTLRAVAPARCRPATICRRAATATPADPPWRCPR
jgi:hypothetical protein